MSGMRDKQDRTSTQRPGSDAEHRGSTRAEESVLEVLVFLRSNWKLLGALTLIFSLAALFLVPFVIPATYSKQLSLAVVVRDSSPLLSRLSVAPLDPDEAGRRAEEYLEEGSFGPVEVRPTYDRATERIRVTLRSANAGALEGVTEEAAEILEAGFRTRYEERMRIALRSLIARSEVDLETNQEIVERIDGQLQGSSAPEALQTQRAVASLEIEQANLELRDLEEAQRNLPRLADEPVSIEVVSESRVRSASSAASRVTFALLIGLLAAVILTMIRNAIVKR